MPVPTETNMLKDIKQLSVECGIDIGLDLNDELLDPSLYEYIQSIYIPKHDLKQFIKERVIFFLENNNDYSIKGGSLLHNNDSDRNDRIKGVIIIPTRKPRSKLIDENSSLIIQNIRKCMMMRLRKEIVVNYKYTHRRNEGAYSLITEEPDTWISKLYNFYFYPKLTIEEIVDDNYIIKFTINSTVQFCYSENEKIYVSIAIEKYTLRRLELVRLSNNTSSGSVYKSAVTYCSLFCKSTETHSASLYSDVVKLLNFFLILHDNCEKLKLGTYNGKWTYSLTGNTNTSIREGKLVGRDEIIEFLSQETIHLVHPTIILVMLGVLSQSALACDRIFSKPTNISDDYQIFCDLNQAMGCVNSIIDSIESVKSISTMRDIINCKIFCKLDSNNSLKKMEFIPYNGLIDQEYRDANLSHIYMRGGNARSIIIESFRKKNQRILLPPPTGCGLFTELNILMNILGVNQILTNTQENESINAFWFDDDISLKNRLDTERFEKHVFENVIREFNQWKIPELHVNVSPHKIITDLKELGNVKPTKLGHNDMFIRKMQKVIVFLSGSEDINSFVDCSLFEDNLYNNIIHEDLNLITLQWESFREKQYNDLTKVQPINGEFTNRQDVLKNITLMHSFMFIEKCLWCCIVLISLMRNSYLSKQDTIHGSCVVIVCLMRHLLSVIEKLIQLFNSDNSKILKNGSMQLQLTDLILNTFDGYWFEKLFKEFSTVATISKASISEINKFSGSLFKYSKK